jgi:regulator of protease activity HflC (stomatin/prohibitin superfamily)
LSAAALGGFTLKSSVFTVQESEMANVRRFGQPRFAQPLSAGIHFKLPFIDEVDRLQVSLTTLHIDPFYVNTVDNQQVLLDLNFNYTVPNEKVNHLLYNVGRAGGASMDASVIPVVKDRAGRVFNLQNTTTISANRESIQTMVSQAVFEAVQELFGLAPHSLQFAKIGYSPAFIESNEMAVKTKNAAVAAQNQIVVERAYAEQKQIKAQGEANAHIAQAEGDAKANIILAEAEKQTKELKGQGEAAYLQAQIDVFAKNKETSANYCNYLHAKAMNQWDGKSPQMMASGASNLATVFPFTKF